MTDFKYIYRMSWFDSKRHTKSHTDLYYEKEEHTRWGHCNPLCRIEVVAVIEDSNEYKAAVNNSILAEGSLFKEFKEEFDGIMRL